MRVGLDLCCFCSHPLAIQLYLKTQIWICGGLVWCGRESGMMSVGSTSVEKGSTSLDEGSTSVDEWKLLESGVRKYVSFACEVSNEMEVLKKTLVCTVWHFPRLVLCNQMLCANIFWWQLNSWMRKWRIKFPFVQCGISVLMWLCAYVFGALE